LFRVHALLPLVLLKSKSSMTLKMSIEQQRNDFERGIVEKPTDAKYVPCMVIFSLILFLSLSYSKA